MTCRFTDLRCKEVINVCNGCRLGCVDDVIVDQETARIHSLIVFGRPKFFGLLGREEDLIIEWCNIQMIGEDTILIDSANSCRHPSRFGKIFGKGS